MNAFAETSGGRLWVGTNEGVSEFLPNSTTAMTGSDIAWDTTSLSPFVIMSLLGEDHLLWAGTINSGLRRINLSTGEMKVFRKRVSDTNSLSANGITAIMRASNGLMLIGTYGGGLNLYDESDDSFIHLMHKSTDESTVSSNNVLALLEDSSGDIWIGTDSGLNLFDPATLKFTRFKSDRSDPATLSSNMAWALHEDENGVLWVGTQSGGLNSWSKKTGRRE